MGCRGFQRFTGTLFEGPYKDHSSFGVYIGVTQFWETTIWRVLGSKASGLGGLRK